MRLIYALKWVFILCNVIFIDLWPDIGRFWPFLEDLGPFLSPYLGEKLGYGYQLQAYINHRLLKPRGKFRARNSIEILRQSQFLCREAIEESTFGGHFWELWSSDFSFVCFAGL
jgi:hypothetical protein